MKKIKWNLSIGYANANQKGEIEVEDDATESDIEEAVKFVVFENVEWNWEE